MQGAAVGTACSSATDPSAIDRSPIDFGSPTPVRIEPLSLLELETGSWYLGWRCSACRWVSAVVPDPTCGALRPRPAGRGVVYFRCPCCLSVNVQGAEDCVQYRRAPPNLTDPSRRRRIVEPRAKSAPDHRPRADITR